MQTVRDHKDLIVWQKAMDLVIAVYLLTKDFPSSELYGLAAQMKRAAVSIPSNIAEGRKRGGQKEYRQFLFVASGSGAELETQLEIVSRLQLAETKHLQHAQHILQEVLKMLTVMTKTFTTSLP